jgi:hypothetical protein
LLKVGAVAASSAAAGAGQSPVASAATIKLNRNFMLDPPSSPG